MSFDPNEVCYTCGADLTDSNKLTRDCPECSSLMCQQCDAGAGTV